MIPSILKETGMHLPMATRRYTDPDTGAVFTGETAKSIVKQVVNHRVNTNTPVDPDKVQMEVEDYICSQLPTWCQRQREPGKIKKEYTREDVLAFVAAVSGTIEAGGVVDQQTAEKRADVCLQCPYNQKLAGCDGCNGIASTVFNLIGARRVRNMGSLRSCGICGCALKAKIWVPDNVLKDTARIQNNMEDFPSWCWVNK